MNNNMYNQPNGTNAVPQNMAQPVAPVQTPNVSATPVQPMVVPGQQPTANKPSAGEAINNFKKTLSNVDKDLAKKYTGMGAGALMILSTFLPYISITVYGMTQRSSLWDSDASVFKILFLIMALIPIVTFFLQKAKSLSYLTAGYALSFIITTFDAYEGANLSFGFYFIFLAAIALIVVCVMEDLAEIKGMFTTKPKVTAGGPVSNVNMQVPPTAVPQTPSVPQAPVQPVQPVMPVATPQPVLTPSVVSPGPVQPVVQNVEVCNFCGQPKKNPTDVICPSCGQRY